MNKAENDIEEFESWYGLYKNSLIVKNDENSDVVEDSLNQNIDPDSSKSEIHIADDEAIFSVPVEQKSIENVEDPIKESESTENVQESSIFSIYPQQEVFSDDDTEYEDAQSVVTATDCSSDKSNEKTFVENAFFPFVRGVGLGTLLTICGLSLVYMNSNNSNTHLNSLGRVSPMLQLSLEHIFSDGSFQESLSSLLNDDILLSTYCENRNTRDCSRRKNLRKKIKKTDRRIKQFIRGYDLKAIRNESGTKTKQQNKVTCPVMEEESNIGVNKEIVMNNSKQMIFGPVTAEQYLEQINVQENIYESTNEFIESEVSMEKYDIMEDTSSESNIVQNQDIDLEEVCLKVPIIDSTSEISEHNLLNDEPNQEEFDMKVLKTSRGSNTDQLTVTDREYKIIYDTFIELENEFQCIVHNQSESDRLDEVQRNRTSLTEEIAILQMTLNNRIEENERIESIIDRQTQLLHEISAKAGEKRRVLYLRRFTERHLDERLELMQKTAERTARKQNNAPSEPITALTTQYTSQFSSNILDDLIDTATQTNNFNNPSSSTSGSESHNEHTSTNEDIIDIMNREFKQWHANNLTCPYKPYRLANSIQAAKRAKKMAAEEVIRFSTRNVEKHDPKKAWKKSQNEYHKK